ncbi:hypothetical protein TI39_contig706g00002 [Zymoseptoria brevis]|uniref:Apple domain-containing protein n=1 Tax=Zymoseptoria brevis TaxID=1047168 RepID=A0A0F4GFJ4_9PEZI|nr:hypothetical protein TI39_contig706g00002 [Zymoseptoria brevis]
MQSRAILFPFSTLRNPSFQMKAAVILPLAVRAFAHTRRQSSGSCLTIGNGQTFGNGYTAECATDRRFGDLSNAPASSFAACAPKCDVLWECIGYSFHESPDGTGVCYFKNSKEASSSASGVDVAFKAVAITTTTSTAAASTTTTAIATTTTAGTCDAGEGSCKKNEDCCSGSTCDGYIPALVGESDSTPEVLGKCSSQITSITTTDEATTTAIGTTSTSSSAASCLTEDSDFCEDSSECCPGLICQDNGLELGFSQCFGSTTTTESATATDSATVTASTTDSASATDSTSSTDSASATGSDSASTSATDSASSTDSTSATVLASATGTDSATNSATATDSATNTDSITGMESASATDSASLTDSTSSTNSASSTGSASSTDSTSSIDSASASASDSATNTATDSASASDPTAPVYPTDEPVYTSGEPIYCPIKTTEYGTSYVTLCPQTSTKYEDGHAYPTTYLGYSTVTVTIYPTEQPAPTYPAKLTPYVTEYETFKPVTTATVINNKPMPLTYAVYTTVTVTVPAKTAYPSKVAAAPSAPAVYTHPATPVATKPAQQISDGQAQVPAQPAPAPAPAPARAQPAQAAPAPAQPVQQIGLPSSCHPFQAR